MLRIVLKLTSLLAVEVIVAIKIIVVVDVDIPAAPVAVAPISPSAAPCCGTERNSSPPHQSRSWHVARIGVGIIGVGGRSSPVHHSRVVRGHINHLRARLLNFDYLLAAGNSLGLHYLLGAGF